MGRILEQVGEACGGKTQRFVAPPSDGAAPPQSREEAPRANLPGRVIRTYPIGGAGLHARKRPLPAFAPFQRFVEDPDGLTVELDFQGVRDAPSGAADGANDADMPRVADAPR